MFQLYIKNGSKHNNRADRIKFTHNGKIVFYVGMYKKYLPEAKYVELYWNNNTRQIGIRPVEEITDNSFALQGKTTRYVTCRGFFKAFDIKMENKCELHSFAIEDGLIKIQAV
jgi:hypothetical protein